MKAGTSSIMCSGGSAAMLSRSRPSLAMFSATRCAPSAGQTSPRLCSSAAASGATSGRSGNTVSRVAMIERCRSIIGQ